MSKNKRNFKKVLAAICAFSGTFGGNSDASDASKNKNTATVKTDVKSKNLSLNRQSGNKNFFEKTWDLAKAHPLAASGITIASLAALIVTPIVIAKSIKGKKDEKSGNPGDGGIKNEKDNLENKEENQEQSQEIKEDSQNQGDGEQNQEQSQGENQEDLGSLNESENEININIVINDHEEFWNNLKFKSNMDNLDGVFKDCGEREINNNLGSDAKVLDLFKESNNVKKFMIGEKVFAFITKKDNLADEEQNLEGLHINFSIPDYAIVCVKGEQVTAKKKSKTRWDFYDGFDCKLDKDLNVLISEKNDD